MDPQAAQTRSQIIQSLFSRRGPDGALEETYIAHLKVWEDAPDDGTGGRPSGGGKSVEDVAGKKARYLMLAGELVHLACASSTLNQSVITQLVARAESSSTRPSATPT